MMAVIVRYLTGDDPERSPAAAVIETEDPRALSIVSILEAAHVLRSGYQHERREIAAALIGLVERRNVVVPEFLKSTSCAGSTRGATARPTRSATHSSRPACPPTRPKPSSRSIAGFRQAIGPS